MFSGKKLLIFGGGFLQQSLIERCKKLGIVTVVIDPFEKALGRKTADFFEVVDGQDFDGTCNVVSKYEVDGIITSATDKPLVMMAQIAAKFRLPFYSVETAKNCTDKYRMKQVFLQNKIPCAEGYLIDSVEAIRSYPVIIKPLDNSGSRGVYFCSNEKEAKMFLSASYQHTKAANILAESYIEGTEYSIESLHFGRGTEVIQITEKITTEFPTNVEVGHLAPAKVSQIEKEAIKKVIETIHKAFGFQNCAAHTEVKINDGKITVIETSPRLGGDFITSHLVPLSTGINMEDQLIGLALGTSTNLLPKKLQHSGAFFFQFDVGKRIKKLPTLEPLDSVQTLKKIEILLKSDESVSNIQSSLDRHGYFILQAPNRATLLQDRDRIFDYVYSNTEYY